MSSTWICIKHIEISCWSSSSKNCFIFIATLWNWSLKSEDWSVIVSSVQSCSVVILSNHLIKSISRATLLFLALLYSNCPLIDIKFYTPVFLFLFFLCLALVFHFFLLKKRRFMSAIIWIFYKKQKVEKILIFKKRRLKNVYFFVCFYDHFLIFFLVNHRDLLMQIVISVFSFLCLHLRQTALQLPF